MGKRHPDLDENEMFGKLVTKSKKLPTSTKARGSKKKKTAFTGTEMKVTKKALMTTQPKPKRMVGTTKLRARPKKASATGKSRAKPKNKCGVKCAHRSKRVMWLTLLDQGATCRAHEEAYKEVPKEGYL